MKDLLKTADLSRHDFKKLIFLAEKFKANPYKYSCTLRNDTVVLYFNKPSTRTRISLETAITRLGGMPVAVGHKGLQLGRGETIEDTAKTISRYAKAFIIRTYKDEDVQRFAQAATIPVINALTDLHHPLQCLADLMTIKERFKRWQGIKIAYLGDGNNVVHSLLEAAALVGVDICIATPSGYQPQKAIVENARVIAEAVNSHITLTTDPYEAVDNADVVYTDVWLSMGCPEEQRSERIRELSQYQVNEHIMQRAKPHAIFMHCLPDHRGEEVTASVIDGPQSVIFDQAENRLHTAKAVLFALLESMLKGRSK